MGSFIFSGCRFVFSFSILQFFMNLLVVAVVVWTASSTLAQRSFSDIPSDQISSYAGTPKTMVMCPITGAVFDRINFYKETSNTLTNIARLDFGDLDNSVNFIASLRRFISGEGARSDPFAIIESVAAWIGTQEFRLFSAFDIRFNTTAKYENIYGVKKRYYRFFDKEIFYMESDYEPSLWSKYRIPYVAANLPLFAKKVIRDAKIYLCSPSNTLRDSPEDRTYFVEATWHAVFGNLPIEDRINRLKLLKALLKSFRGRPVDKLLKNGITERLVQAYSINQRFPIIVPEPRLIHDGSVELMWFEPLFSSKHFNIIFKDSYDTNRVLTDSYAIPRFEVMFGGGLQQIHHQLANDPFISTYYSRLKFYISVHGQNSVKAISNQFLRIFIALFAGLLLNFEVYRFMDYVPLLRKGASFLGHILNRVPFLVWTILYLLILLNELVRFVIIQNHFGRNHFQQYVKVNYRPKFKSFIETKKEYSG